MQKQTSSKNMVVLGIVVRFSLFSNASETVIFKIFFYILYCFDILI
jgi:hypothetical protein